MRYRVNSNSSTSSRTASLTVAGRTHTVRQDGAAPPPPPPPPPPAQRITLNGRVRDLGGSCPNISFRVDGRTVTADGSTRFPFNQCGWVREDFRVRVNGEVRPDGRVRALEIEFRRDDDDDDDDD